MKIGLGHPKSFRIAYARVSNTLDASTANPCAHHSPNLAIVSFDNRESMTTALARPASEYEQTVSVDKVRSTFVGINFPMEVLLNWWNLRTRKCAAVDEGVFLEVRTDSHSANMGANRATFSTPSYFTPSPSERSLMAAFSDHVKNPDPSLRYLVAFTRGDGSTFRHELAHALFYLCTGYRDAVVELWDSLASDQAVTSGGERIRFGTAGKQLRSMVEKRFREWGYHSRNFVDEFQAYTVEDPTWFEKNAGTGNRANFAVLSGKPPSEKKSEVKTALDATLPKDAFECIRMVAARLSAVFDVAGGDVIIRHLEVVDTTEPPPPRWSKKKK
ncbi:hypothetical protein HDU93_009820 [Gonapodya sp. JEL0774]|nr:hypothetical protein HDU93_009820 [Gonapodya sp. JEL0774]